MVGGTPEEDGSLPLRVGGGDGVVEAVERARMIIEAIASGLVAIHWAPSALVRLAVIYPVIRSNRWSPSVQKLGVARERASQRAGKLLPYEGLAGGRESI